MCYDVLDGEGDNNMNGRTKLNELCLEGGIYSNAKGEGTLE